MKSIITALLFNLLLFTSFGQNIDCDSLAREYCNNSKCIMNMDAFCLGIESALNYEGLAIKGTGDPGHVDYCTYYSYEKYGVELILTGDIVFPNQEDENAGFNAIMIPQIKDSLGCNYDFLGKTDSAWKEIDEIILIQEITTPFYLGKAQTDQFFTVFIDSTLIQNTIFGTFEGIKFQSITGEEITLEQFYRGVQIKKIAGKKTYIRADFSNYSNGNNFCQATENWTFPFPFKYSK